MKHLISGSACLFVFVSIAGATTIHVPDDYVTINEALDHASPGDTVLVAPGEYNEDPRIYGGITLKSSGGPVTTKIIGTAMCWDHHALTSTLEGFTITGSGPGVYIVNSDVVISGNVIVDNGGDGVSLHDSDGDHEMVAQVIGNTIANNGIIGIWFETWNAYAVGNVIVGHQYYGIAATDYTSPAWIRCNGVWNNGVDFWYVYGHESISADPLFCNPSIGDYTLAAGSPCLNDPTCGRIGALGQGCDIPTGLGTSASWGEVKALFR